MSWSLMGFKELNVNATRVINSYLEKGLPMVVPTFHKLTEN